MVKRFGPLAVLIAVVVTFAAWMSSDSHRVYVAFKDSRNQWHRDCDQYRQTDLRTSAEARACNARLQVLVAEAKRRGWTD